MALCTSCDSRKAPQPATSDAVAGEEDSTQSVPAVLAPPPGEPGPFLVQLDNLFPSQMFGAAANENFIAVAMQSDARDVSLCPATGLPVCFRGNAVISARKNPNTPIRVPLYESDTQSGSRVDDIAASTEHFAFALREGLYVGDAFSASLVIVNTAGNIEHQIALSSPQTYIAQSALAQLDEKQAVLCTAQTVSGITQKYQIVCESVDLKSSARAPIAAIESRYPVRALDVAAIKDKALVAYASAGHMYAAWLDNTDEILDLGIATAARPLMASGLDKIAVAWQADDATFHVDAIDPAQNIRQAKRRSLVLNGVQNRTINGLAPISHGYVFAFRHENTQQVALISADFKSWNLLDNSLDWRLFAGYGVLDIQDAHTGKILWQTAESLVQKQ